MKMSNYLMKRKNYLSISAALPILQEQIMQRDIIKLENRAVTYAHRAFLLEQSLLLALLGPGQQPAIFNIVQQTLSEATKAAAIPAAIAERLRNLGRPSERAEAAAAAAARSVDAVLAVQRRLLEAKR